MIDEFLSYYPNRIHSGNISRYILHTSIIFQAKQKCEDDVKETAQTCVC